jgi:dipeptidyl aminopeptidase/acylaminoacyl peptidase
MVLIFSLYLNLRFFLIQLFMKQIIFILCFSLSMSSIAQKKVLDHADFDVWNSIASPAIANDGSHILYSLEKGEKDKFLKLKTNKAKTVFTYDRVAAANFTHDSKFVLFTINAWKDSIVEMKRRKVKKEKMPKDTLGIFDIKSQKLTKIANVKSYQMPEKWAGYVAYYLEDTAVAKKKTDTKEEADESKKETPKKKVKKVGKTTGYHLVLRNLASQKEDTLQFVTNFSFAKEGKRLAYTSTGTAETKESGVFVLNLENGTTSQVFSSDAKATYFQVSLSDDGSQLGFIVDQDTTKVQVRPNELYFSKNAGKALKLADAASAPKGYRVSADGNINFSKNNSKMYFGLATPLVVQDTTLIPEEIVSVEVWAYDSPKLYTVQELQVKNDQKKSFTTVVHLDQNKMVQLATEAYPFVQLEDEVNADNTLVSNTLPYELESQWTGVTSSDYLILNTSTGDVESAFTKFPGRVQLSPKAKYAYGYHAADSTWYAYDIATKTITNLTKGQVFYNELNDTPSNPRAYGMAGWTENDEAIILYDRYDLFSLNPITGVSKKLTNGRASKTVYRYVSLDKEERFLNISEKWLLKTFNEKTKNSGYYEFDPKKNKGKQLLEGPYMYSSPIKAQESKELMFTRQSFIEYPNIRVSDVSFQKELVISDANPQQKDYNWGTIELVDFTSLDGKSLQGLLVKPENFDPNKKYPMLVNFYERDTDQLHRHRAPSPGRSSINYSFYTSRGYVIFNPDIVYRDGYPGESAYNSVIAGVTQMIEKGFVDKNKIGAQGHSWGGYQVAHLATKTNIFAAIESGAPVVNMISAYGGIRWWTGLSRQFQYEHTQSRIGGTPWEYPLRYIENSPIFNMDKINTPILIMHNDADGHVPWYQGIEFFTALRRLGKTSWFLNYNEEPHWPLKMQHRKDFNIRMAQFFDHYLKGAAKPKWMEGGVPAIEKGIHQGYELLDKK